MHKEADERRADEALGAELTEIGRCGYAEVARIVEIMAAGARRSGDDPRVQAGIGRLEKLFGRAGTPDKMGAALAEMAVLRDRVNDPRTSDFDADAALSRLVELDEIVAASQATTFAALVPAFREAKRQWAEFHVRAGELGHDVMTALLGAVDALPLASDGRGGHP